MKTRIKRISRRTVSMVLAVLLMLSILSIGSLITASAMALNNGHIYFDATALIAANSDWGSHRLNIVYNYNGTNATYKPMTRISNTNLYYIQGSTTNYDNTSYLAFFSGDWNVNGENNQTWSNIYQYCLDITNKYTTAYDFNTANSVYYITATAGTGNKARVVSAPTCLGTNANAATRYGYLNKTLTVKTALYNGSTYDDASSTKYGTFTASGHKLNGANSSTSSSISQTNGTGTITTARSTTVSVTQEPEDGYEFVGWKAGSIDSSGSDLSNSYSFSNTGSDATVYAYYRRDSSPSLDSFNTNHATLNLGEEATLSSTYTNAPNGVTYSIKSGSESKVSLDSDTVTAIAPGTATLVATLVDDPTKTRELNIDVNTPAISTFQYGNETNDGTTSAKAYPIYAAGTSVDPIMAVSNTNVGADVTYSYTIGNGTYGSVASDGKITAESTPNASQTVTATATITYNGVTYITATKTAYYKVYAYYLLGFRNKVDNPWTKNAANMMTPDTDSGWLTINRTLSGGTTTYGSGSNNDNDTGFKVAYYDGSTTTYYSNSGTVTATITKETINSNNGTWVYASNVNNNARLTTKNCSTDDAVYKFYFKESTKQLAVYYPLKITYDKNGGNTTQYEAVPYGEHANLPATNPTRTGYTFTTWTTTDNGNTTFDFTSARTADATAYAKWSEDTVDVTIKAFTGGSESTTGGTVLPTSVNVGIDTSASSVATANAASGYIFNGWQVVGSHINLYTDAECSTPYVAGDRTHTTIYIKTDGTKPLGSENYVRADFVNGARTYVVGTMVKDDMGNYTTAKASAVANTGDGFNATTTIANSGSVVLYGNASMSTTGDISATDTQNPTVNFDGATNNGGSYEFTYVKYQFMGWKKSDTAITEVSGDNTSWDETDASISPEVPASGEGYWYACYRKQYVFCAFRSYDYMAGAGGQIIFIASPPTKYQIGSADATGYTEQGKKIVVPAGEQLKLTYTSLASSDCIDHVYYDDTDYTTATPTAENFDTSNQHEITTGISTDQSAHEVTINMTQNYKNIHIALGSKYKVFFSDEKNAIIHSKNVDNYYAPGEAMSGATEAKYLTVKAAGNASQTNSIISSDVKFYYCNSTGEYTDASGNLVDTPVEITGTDLAFEAGDSTSSGDTDGTARKITGTMPNTNVYVDLGLATTYDFYIGSKIVSDTTQNRVAWRQVAGIDITYKPDDTEYTFSATQNTVTSEQATWNSGAVTAVKQGDSVKMTWEYWDISSGGGEAYSTKYMFLGWYKGDSSGPKYDKKNLLSEKKTFVYTPKANVYVWAVGTRDMFINGTMSITGADTEVGNWPSTNFKMKFDPDYVNPDGGARGRYYWEITEDMLNATSDPGKLTGLHTDNNGVWIPNGLGGQNTAGWNRAESNSYFRIYDSSTITDSNSDSQYWDETGGLSYWTSIDKQNNNNSDLNWGKALDGDSGGDTRKTLGLGYINYNPTTYPAYSAPIRIYAYPGKGINVEATPIYSNLYISNGFDVGATSKDTAVSVTASGGDSFTITTVDTYTGSNEGTVTHYKPEKKNATVRISKTCTATEKVSAFFVYDLDNDTVYSLKDVQNSSNDWYIDLTVKLQQNLYIVPIIEETSANVTVNFDATQLNKTQWGDIVSCYAWYGSGSALGAFPGQPMIVSDDLGSWTAKFPDTKTVGGTKYNLMGITFSNYVDGNQSWLGRTSTTGRKPVMSTVTYSNTSVSGGVGSIRSVADDGLIKQYNKITSGSSQEYSRQNFKAQTYDYREPIAIYKNSGNAEGVETTITFAMKDGDSSLLSWRHTELLNNNIINLPEGWTKLNWEYLTDSTGNKYADLNGRAMDTKPTATYYVAAKGGYVYKDGDVTAAFYSGKSYDTADHSYVNVDYYNTVGNTYTVDGNPVKSYDDNGTPTYESYNNYGWVHDECPRRVSYGDSENTSADPNDINFDYAVQWYVYDASGNYITTVLSSALADMNTAKTETYIARELTNLGYAVDGKAVAMCYDKPRYYYWNSAEVTYGAAASGTGKVNSGEGFAGYRFTGQWYTTVETEPVTVNVRVGMMTDSGEVVSDSNVAGYGSASAVYSTANNTATYASQITSDGTKSITIALADAEKRIVKLDATDTNFIGWYYYDTNTGEFVKASYDSNSDFFPNFKKDVTYYAMYEAAATYEYKYNGREMENGTFVKTYSVSGGDLTAEEMGAGNIISLESLVGEVPRSTDLVTKAPIGKIGVFKRTLDFSQAQAGGSITYNNSKEYTMTASNFKNEADTYTLTAHYVDSAGQNRTMAVNAVYNGQAVELLDNSGVPIGKQWTGHKFVGWYSYDGSTYGELLSAHPKYGLRLTRNQDIIAVYENDGSGKTLPTVADVWHAYIDENTVTKEMYGENSGRYYNDTIVRVRNDLDVNTALPDGAEVGVVMINDNRSGDATDEITDTNIKKVIKNVASGNTVKIKGTNLSATKVSTTTVTSFNRSDVAIRGDYAKMKDSAYTIYSYIKISDDNIVLSSSKSGSYTA